MIGKLFGLVPVNDTVYWPKEETSATSPIMGIELELENIPDWTKWVQTGFHRKEDGSLRNHGSEFVSVPMKTEQLLKAVSEFYRLNKVSDRHISERCSVHIHLNCQDLTVEQLVSLCKTYQVVERVLFNFVGGERDKSIFCVPWYDTTIVAATLFKEPVQPGRFKFWQKYTALNLLPLFQFGTVEFRHLAGQGTVEPILKWIKIIKALHQFSVHIDPKELDNILLGLNTTSQYDHLINNVFLEHADELKTEGYKQALEDGVLALKYMLFDNFVKPPLGANKDFLYFDDVVAEQVAINNMTMPHAGGTIRWGEVFFPTAVPRTERAPANPRVAPQSRTRRPA